MESNVDSATLHVPVNENLHDRLATIKQRGLSKVHDVQRSLADKRVSMQSQVKRSMASNPMKWAGIAAGSGFALGILGRLMHRRTKHAHGPILDVVVIV